MESKNMEQIYQKIASVLVDIIPESWDKIYLYAEYREGYEKVFFHYYPEGKDQTIYNLNIPDIFHISEDEFDSKKQELYSVFADLWNDFKEQGQEQWTHLTLILDHTGKIIIDYGYEDLSDLGPLGKQKEWEAKYLT